MLIVKQKIFQSCYMHNFRKIKIDSPYRKDSSINHLSSAHEQAFNEYSPFHGQKETKVQTAWHESYYPVQ